MADLTDTPTYDAPEDAASEDATFEENISTEHDVTEDFSLDSMLADMDIPSDTDGSDLEEGHLNNFASPDIDMTTAADVSATDDLDDITDLSDIIDTTHAGEAEEDALIAEILEDTIVLEENIQDEIQSDIKAQLSSLTEGLDDVELGGSAEDSLANETAETTGLSKLAALLDEAPETDNAVGSDLSKTALVGGTLAASLAAAATLKPSALDNLLEDDFDIEKVLDDTADETAANDPEVVEALLDITSDDQAFSDDEDGNIDALLSDIINEADQPAAAETVKGIDEEDIDLGDALAGLLDDSNMLDDDLGTEIDVPELDATDAQTSEADVLAAILNEDPVEDVDVTSEAVEINVETSQTEIADMARKTATDTILDEVTETAASSAFASLTNVVEEKAVVAERGDRIGDLVTEALQPMLKEWLDKNLKGIVERAVTKEVKRISSGK